MDRSMHERSDGIRLAHVSDVHFGKISHAGIVKALVEEINAEKMDLVVGIG